MTEWHVHYGGTVPVTLAGITWQPDSTRTLPEALARTLVGTHDLRRAPHADYPRPRRP